jgi:hypothetical protein
MLRSGTKLAKRTGRKQILKYLIPIAAAVVVAGCTPGTTPIQPTIKAEAAAAGSLFCAVQTAGGGAMIVAVIDAAATAAAPAAAPVAVIATGAGKAIVDAACAQAAANVGAPAGVPVSPPAAGTVVPQVAVVVSRP